MTAIIEEMQLGDLNLDDVPPCECFRGKTRCGKPSAFRILTICSGCGDSRTIFICVPCHDIVRKNMAECKIDGCTSNRGITEYR